jgi:hypothetical protein
MEYAELQDKAVEFASAVLEYTGMKAERTSGIRIDIDAGVMQVSVRMKKALATNLITDKG